MLPDSLNSLYSDLYAVGDVLGVGEAVVENKASLIAQKVLIRQERTSDGKITFHAEKKPWGWGFLHAIQRFFHIAPKEEYNFTALVDSLREEYSVVTENLSTKENVIQNEYEKIQFLTLVLNNLIDHVNKRKGDPSQPPLPKIEWQQIASLAQRPKQEQILPADLQARYKQPAEKRSIAESIAFSLNAFKAKMRGFDKLEEQEKTDLAAILHKIERVVTNPNFKKIEEAPHLAHFLEERGLTPEKLKASLQAQRHDLSKMHKVVDTALEKVSELQMLAALADQLEGVKKSASNLQKNPIFTHVFSSAGQFLVQIADIKISYDSLDDLKAQAEMLRQFENALQALAEIPMQKVASKDEFLTGELQTKAFWEELGKKSFGKTWTNVLQSKEFKNFVTTIEKSEYWSVFFSVDKVFLDGLKASENQLQPFVMPIIALSKSIKTVLFLNVSLRQGLDTLQGKAGFVKRDLYSEYTTGYQKELQEIKKVKVPEVQKTLPKSVQSIKQEVSKDQAANLRDAVDRFKNQRSAKIVEEPESDSDDWK
jgi:hypothetical protein